MTDSAQAPPPASPPACPATSPPASPPAYTVRESPRARRVTLRMSVDRGLEVVVPRGFGRARVPAIVREKAAWIARMEERMAPERARLAAEPPDSLPERIHLRAVGETWTVEYRETASTRVTVREHGPPGRLDRAEATAGSANGAAGRAAGAGGLAVAACAGGGATLLSGGAATVTGLLRVSGAVGDPEACRAALGRWLARRAAALLVPLLEAAADEEGLMFSSVAVRGQRTRWGSCSRRSAINLNRHLLFLPPELVRYVLVHELCHTVRPDHSRRFWEEVLRREPGAVRLRKELRAAGRHVPGWARATPG